MLYEKLKEHAKSGIYPMHMPGHKRNTELLPPGLPYEIDVSEIYGFDNLQNPQSILKETADIAAAVYKSDRAFLLVNGSTAGILAAIGAHAVHGDTMLMARNCHMSVYNAVALFGLKPTYIIPETDEKTGISLSVDPASVEAALESNKEIKLMVITSPTYEGVISDISAIAGIAHERGIPLIVDQAHGAHLGFSDSLPGSAVKSGADIVVMSLHKTLPALTQCGLLHVCGGRANTGEISRLLSVFQTSSPSYVLMSSIDRCLRLLESDRARLFDGYERNLERFDREVKSLNNLSVLCKGGDGSHSGIFMFDPGKIVIVTKKTALSGLSLADALREEYKIELESACADYAIAMTSICDTAEGFVRLATALIAIDRQTQIIRNPEFGIRNLNPPEQAFSPGEAFKRKGGFVPLEESPGAISMEYVWAYPPGIPIIVPGEIISEEIVAHIDRMINVGVKLNSTRNRLPEYIYTN